MKLTIINGSPRGMSSNSKILAEQFIEGIKDVDADFYTEVFYLRIEKEYYDKIFESLKETKNLFLIFPLYTDAMPAYVKSFLEAFGDNADEIKLEKMAAFVQSGFPEGHHSVYVKRYLEKYMKRFGIANNGVGIRGGVEGIQVMPEWMTKKLMASMRELGQKFAKTSKLDQVILDKLIKPYQLSLGRRLMFRIMALFGMTDFYWNSQLKKNNAFDRRLDRPYKQTI